MPRAGPLNVVKGEFLVENFGERYVAPDTILI